MACSALRGAEKLNKKSRQPKAFWKLTGRRRERRREEEREQLNGALAPSGGADVAPASLRSSCCRVVFGK